MCGEQLARQWKIIRLLEARKHGLTAAEISESLDSHVRTIYRDLEAIQEAGFPLYIEKVEKSSYWKLMDGFRTNLPLPFTATELMSLHMSRDIIRVFEGTIFQESIESLLSKVRAALPPETMRYLDSISARVRVGFGSGKDYGALREIIATLSDATAKKRNGENPVFRIVYGKRDLETGRPIPSVGNEWILLPNRFMPSARRSPDLLHGPDQ